MHPYPITRPIQTVAVQASPAANDLIQPMAYDTLGRQIKGYLPYAGKTTDVTGSYRPNAISTDQPNFYNQTGQYLIPTDSDPYAQQVFDNSPLQRVLEAGQVGNGFQPGQHYKAVTYRYNTSADTVWIWSNTGTHTGGNNYAVNTLSVTDGKDEDNVETLVFTDMLGRAILKRQLLGANHLDTYYIYDNSGMLIDMLPPLAVAKMKSSGNYSLTQSGISALVFSYVYDNKGRLNQKNLPGKVVINIIYDPLSRPVLMRDANLAANHQWNYIKYDVKGRAVSQGIYTDNNDTTSTQMQAYVNGLSSSYSTAWYESRSTSANNNGYYTDNIFPTGTVTGTSISPLAYEYFDNYTLTTGTTYSYHTTGLAGELGATSAQIKGMPTMVQKSMVGSGMTAKWLISVVFYDHNLRTIQTQTNNILYYQTATTITDTTTTVPDFVGAATVSKQVKITGTGSTNKASVQTTLTYDQVHRVTAIDQSYNGTSTVHIAQYVYNELGQVVQKKLGETSTGWLQNVDFRYNIRGQLLYINNSKLANDTGKTNSDTNDLFGMQLLYDQTDSNLGNTPYYSGRLSAVKWMSKDGSNNSSYERAFKYYYDAVDRDTAAIYAERPATSTSAFTTTHGWDENRITYDQNGNLLTLFRDSTSQGSGGHTPIDNLTYTYSNTYPNQLSTVSDATHNSSGFVGGTGTYTYDANGNLTNEPYKGLSHLYYNALNRTDKITFTSSANRYITYIYDANGTLIRKMQYDNVGGVATLMYTTDYIDGFVYITAGTGSPALSYVQMPEGRSLYNGSGFTQEYVIGDHQGNTRICFNNTGAEGTAQVVQENSYYAFGLIMPGTTVSTGTTPNKNLYNGGSEWQNDYSNLPDYYQTYNRNYDAALGRFVSVDPDPESAEGMSNYQYAGNMPMMFNDPDGNRASPVGNAADIEWEQTTQTTEHEDQLNPAYNPGLGSGGGAFALEQAEFDLFSDITTVYAALMASQSHADFTAQTLIGAIKSLWNNSYYGGWANGDVIHFYSSPEEALGRNFQIFANEGLIGSRAFPGSSSSLDDAVGRYNSVIADQNTANGTKGGFLALDANGHPVQQSDLYYGIVLNLVIIPEHYNLGEHLEALEKAVGPTDKAILFGDVVKTIANDPDISMVEILGKATGFVTLANFGYKAYDAYRRGDKFGVLKYGLATAGQGIAMAVGDEFEVGYNLGAMVGNWIFGKH